MIEPSAPRTPLPTSFNVGSPSYWPAGHISKQKTLQDAYEVDLTDETFSSTSTYGSFSMPWNPFHKYKTNKDMILVYQSAVLYHIFPKRWFTESQLTEFHSILQKQLGHPKA